MHILVGFSLPLITVITIGMAFIGLPALAGVYSLGLSLLIFLFLWGLVKTRSSAVALSVPLAVIILMTAWSLGFMSELLFPVRAGTAKK